MHLCMYVCKYTRNVNESNKDEESVENKEMNTGVEVYLCEYV
jgi:hypothetical protein